MAPRGRADPLNPGRHGRRLALVDQEPRELASGIYLAEGYAAFDFDLVGGGATRAVLRSTLVLTRRSEGWRIAQHHFSATPAEPPIPPPGSGAELRDWPLWTAVAEIPSRLAGLEADGKSKRR